MERRAMKSFRAGIVIVKVLVAAVLIVVLGIVGVYVARNVIVKMAIERGGTYAFGVPTTVGSLRLDILGTSFSMERLNIENPEGFGRESFFALSDAHLAVDEGSLFGQTIKVPFVTFEGLLLSLELLGSRGNYDVILGNLQRMQRTGSERTAQKSSGSKARLVIGELLLRDITVNARFAPVEGVDASSTLTIESIQLTNVGGTGEGATIEEVLGAVIQAILSTTVRMGGTILPSELLLTLGTSLSSLEDLSARGIDLAMTAGEQAKQEIEETVEGLKEELPEEAIEDMEALGADLMKQMEEISTEDSGQ
jgi:hypothetical protein